MYGLKLGAELGIVEVRYTRFWCEEFLLLIILQDLS